MQRHFVQELDALKASLIRMGSLAEHAIEQSVTALLERRADLAREVLAQDARINACEIANDNAVIDLLALQQPVATDLRFLVAALKINYDLERIGDHAVNIAESAINIALAAPVESHLDIPRMARITRTMLHDAIDGFIRGEADLCRAVLRNDDVIDDLNRRVVAGFVEVIRRAPDTLDRGLELIRISRNLERVADLATNIAEEVIYMAEARVVKHRAEG